MTTDTPLIETVPMSQLRVGDCLVDRDNAVIVEKLRPDPRIRADRHTHMFRLSDGSSMRADWQFAPAVRISRRRLPAPVISTRERHALTDALVELDRIHEETVARRDAGEHGTGVLHTGDTAHSLNADIIRRMLARFDAEYDAAIAEGQTDA